MKTFWNTIWAFISLGIFVFGLALIYSIHSILSYDYPAMSSTGIPIVVTIIFSIMLGIFMIEKSAKYLYKWIKNIPTWQIKEW